MTAPQHRARAFGIGFIAFACGAIALDSIGALRSEHAVSVRIAEIAPFVIGTILLIYSARTR